jgi:hypothetical protein
VFGCRLGRAADLVVNHVKSSYFIEEIEVLEAAEGIN